MASSPTLLAATSAETCVLRASTDQTKCPPAEVLRWGRLRECVKSACTGFPSGVENPGTHRSSVGERVFKLFERLNPEVEGTVVGLMLVRSILEGREGRN